MTYLISYDLTSHGKDYAQFYKALSHLGAEKILMSLWILRHPKDDIEGLRGYLWRFMDEKDRLFITTIDKSKFVYRNLMMDIEFFIELENSKNASI